MTDRDERPELPADGLDPARPGRHALPPAGSVPDVREREAVDTPATGSVQLDGRPRAHRSWAERDSFRDEDDDGPGVEFQFRLPAAMRGLVDTRRELWTRTDSIAAGMIAAHLGLLLLVLYPGSLYIDDLRAQGYAQGQGFWGFIVGSNGTHFAPLPRIVDWVQSRAFPLQHGPAVFMTLVVRGLLAVAFYRLLRRVFGIRSAILVPLGVLLVTPALLPGTAWYRQSITIVACTVAIVWAVDAHVRYVTGRRQADLVAVVAATAVGLGCYEKAAAIPVILAGVTLAMFHGGPPAAQPGLRRGGARGGTPFRAGVRATAASAAVVVVFLLIYRAGPYDQGSGSAPSPFDVLQLAWNVVVQHMLPMLLGGPWTWIYLSPFVGTPRVGLAGIVVSFLVFAGLLAWSARQDANRVGRAMVVLLAWVLPSALLISYGRGDSGFDQVLDETTRLWSDLVPGLLFAFTLAALPWRVGARATPEPAPRAVPEGATPAGPAQIVITPGMLAGGVALLVVLGGSLWSTWNYADNWWDNPTDEWVANARTSLDNAEAFPRVVATPLPEYVMPFWVTTRFPTNAPLIMLLRPDARFHDADGPARMIDDSGALVPAFPKVVAQSKRAPVCAALIPPDGSGEARVPMSTPAPALPGAQVDVGVLLDRPTTVEVTVEQPDGTVSTLARWSRDDLPKGPHTVRYALPPGVAVAAVKVRAESSQASCVTLAHVWLPVTVPGAS